MPQLASSPVAQDDAAQAGLALDAATPDAGTAQPMLAADEAADSTEDAGRVHIGGGMMHF